MPKLQRVKRTNGSVVYSVNIPLEVIERLEWTKGTELAVEVIEDDLRGSKIIIKKGDEHG